MVTNSKKSINFYLMILFGILCVILFLIGYNNYYGWRPDYDLFLLFIPASAVFLYTCAKYRYQQYHLKLESKQYNFVNRKMLTLKEKIHPLNPLSENRYFLLLYVLYSVLFPLLLYGIPLCLWLYNSIYTNNYIGSGSEYIMFANFSIYHLTWIPYYLQYCIPVIWLLLNTYFYVAYVQKDEIQTLCHLLDSVSDNCSAMNPQFYPNHPFYPLLEQIQKVNILKQEAVEKSIQNERTKVELITNVSHDLKTPLTAVTNYVELLSKEPLSAVCKDYVEVISSKLQKLSEMITSVFELSKTASGAATLNFVPLDMNCLIEQVVSDLTADSTEQNDRIRLNLCKESTQFSGDSVSLYRILQNLIGNALKYSLKGTRIYLQTQTVDSLVKVSIINTANYEMTFSPSDITERFVRGDVSRSTEGNGLGLAIAKTYTDACNGTLDIVTEGDQFKAVLHFPSIAS